MRPYIHHLFFFCTPSRTSLFHSPLRIRSEMLRVDILSVVIWARGMLHNEDFSLFLTVMWRIWISRNKFIYQGIPANPSSIMTESLALQNKSKCAQQQPGIRQQTQIGISMPTHLQMPCLLDAAHDPTGTGAIGQLQLLFTPDKATCNT